MDPLPLVLFRAAYGAVMFYYLVRHFLSGTLWFRLYDTTFQFKHLEWLPLIHVDLFCLLVVGAAAGALLLAFGIKTRWSAAVLFVGFSYLWLLEKSSYNNHYYLMSLLALLFIFTGGSRRDEASAAWKLWLFRFQLAVVYFFAGLAKIQPDWLAAEPISIWFGRKAQRLDQALLGQDFTHFAASLGGLYLDLFAPLFLLWKPGRWVIIPLLLLFHCANHQLFSIGVFPSLMVASTVLFFDGPELRKLGSRIPSLGFRPVPGRAAGELGEATRPEMAQLLVLGGVLVYCSLQILLPLRQFATPGDPSWTESSHWFSWRMMLRTKSSSQPSFYRYTRDGVAVHIPGATSGLHRRQLKDLGAKPHMLEQYARELSRRYGEPIFVTTRVRMNRWPEQALIDPTVRFGVDGPSKADFVLPQVPRENPRPIPRWALLLHFGVLMGLAVAAWKATGSRWWLAVLVPTGLGAWTTGPMPYLAALVLALGVGFWLAGRGAKSAPLWSLSVCVPLLLSLAYLVSPAFQLLR